MAAAQPQEIAGDARPLYGPLAGRPAAAALGDRALWVDPDDGHALYQVQSGNWVRIGTGTAAPPAPAGVGVLHGPYVVDFSDIATDGSTKTLWTPQAGDILVGLFPNLAVRVSFGGTAATYRFGQDNSTDDTAFMADTDGGDPAHFALPSSIRWMWRLPTSDPIHILRVANGDADLTAGHIEYYALVARAVAP